MLSFEENFIPDETERLKFLLEEYAPFLIKHATPTTVENHDLISKLLQDKTPHVELLKNIRCIFATDDGKPKPLIPSNDIENKLGPNRSAEYFGLHADICYMVTQYISKNISK